MKKYLSVILVFMFHLSIYGQTKIIPVLTYKDSLLTGKFKFEANYNDAIEGEAMNGKLIKIKRTNDGLILNEFIFTADSVKIRRPDQYYDNVKVKYDTYKLVSNPTITNSKTLCMKYGNFNGFPYLMFPKHDDVIPFDLNRLKDIVINYFPEPLEVKISYTDSLLNGEFQFREYIYSNDMFLGEYADIKGVAINGRITNLSVTNTKLQQAENKILSQKKIEYLILENKIIKNDYVPLVSADPVATNELKLEYPVLLTNSKILGGEIANNDIRVAKNILGNPYQRNYTIQSNQFGFLYFNPYFFETQKYIKLITTITQKPVVRKINPVNGMLDGDFEFKEDRIHFTGNATNGIIQKLSIKTDFENSKYIGGKSIKYDLIEINIEGDSYLVIYSLSSSNLQVLEEKNIIVKNKKITNSVDLSEYDNFIYFNNDGVLRRILLNMEFYQK